MVQQHSGLYILWSNAMGKKLTRNCSEMLRDSSHADMRLDFYWAYGVDDGRAKLTSFPVFFSFEFYANKLTSFPVFFTM